MGTSEFPAGLSGRELTFLFPGDTDLLAWGQHFEHHALTENLGGVLGCASLWAQGDRVGTWGESLLPGEKHF